MPDLSAPPAPFAIARRFDRGAIVLEAGSAAETVYLLRAGQVRFYLLRESGQETTTAILGRNQFFGIERLLGHSVYRGFVEALTPVDVWAMPAGRLLERLAEDADLQWLVVNALARQLALAQTLVEGVALMPVSRRITSVLEQVEECLGGERPRLTNELLASLVGTRSETISRVGAGARATG